jgi:hypothetical protein
MPCSRITLCRDIRTGGVTTLIRMWCRWELFHFLKPIPDVLPSSVISGASTSPSPSPILLRSQDVASSLQSRQYFHSLIYAPSLGILHLCFAIHAPPNCTYALPKCSSVPPRQPTLSSPPEKKKKTLSAPAIGFINAVRSFDIRRQHVLPGPIFHVQD